VNLYSTLRENTSNALKRKMLSRQW